MNQNSRPVAGGRLGWTWRCKCAASHADSGTTEVVPDDDRRYVGHRFSGAEVNYRFEYSNATNWDPRPVAANTARRLDMSFATQVNAPPSTSGIMTPSTVRVAI